MTIEIKQLTITSNIKSEDNESTAVVSDIKQALHADSLDYSDIDAVRSEILAECTRMIRRSAEDQRSR